MNWVGRSAATALLGASTLVALAAPGKNVPGSDSPRPSQQAAGAPIIQVPGAASAPEQQRHAIARAGASGCTVATADRSTTAVAQCTGCHGEPGTARGRNMFQMPGHEFGHPVDVDLDALRSAHPELYASRSELPAFLPLPGGKITCLTCHDGRAGNPHALARASQKELCLACHKM